MKRMIATLALAATMVLASASVALAGPNENAWCAGTSGDDSNHGAHITIDYVDPSLGTADPGVRFHAAHFGDNGTAPGASFCQGDGNSAPSLDGTPGRFA